MNSKKSESGEDVICYEKNNSPEKRIPSPSLSSPRHPASRGVWVNEGVERRRGVRVDGSIRTESIGTSAWGVGGDAIKITRKKLKADDWIYLPPLTYIQYKW
ncbi:hypothetical protein GWI33_015268 [Rhynchophorus ferrugineus]|uniref:Uncharacterized protein n=1 Tax=Rhynchophorus ferrugineus TaxID=354439 RepID=A0A834IDL6_RHYFE|nr:hypothetical protein GWI33_015268 [Rhynchophorus ferrugineus]